MRSVEKFTTEAYFQGVCLADSEDHVIQNIINGDRPELPKKEAFGVPNDLAISRSPLFGRSHPDQTPSEESGRNRVVKRSREEILNGTAVENSCRS